MRVLRSVASVLVSYVVVYGIVILSDPVLTHFFPTQYVPGKVPPTFLLWISTAVFFLASIIGGWLCALIAPARLGLHLFALFLLGEIIGLAFTARLWASWPHWYSLVWLAVWPVCLWIGSTFRRQPYSARPVSPPQPIS